MSSKVPVLRQGSASAKGGGGSCSTVNMYDHIGQTIAMAWLRFCCSIENNGFKIAFGAPPQPLPASGGTLCCSARGPPSATGNFSKNQCADGSLLHPSMTRCAALKRVSVQGGHSGLSKQCSAPHVICVGHWGAFWNGGNQNGSAGQ